MKVWSVGWKIYRWGNSEIRYRRLVKFIFLEIDGQPRITAVLPGYLRFRISLNWPAKSRVFPLVFD